VDDGTRRVEPGGLDSAEQGSSGQGSGG